MLKLVICDARPVQYRAPVFRRLNELRPGMSHVLYSSVSSVRGYEDLGFGTSVAWDTDLLAGYTSTVLNTERTSPVRPFRRFGGKGVYEFLRAMRPSAVLLHTLGYEFDWAVAISAVRLGIPLWARMETQDHAEVRATYKRIGRHAVYRAFYPFLSRVFYIGQLNRQHLLLHGVREDRLRPCLYCTPDPIAICHPSDLALGRVETRLAHAVVESDCVVGFSGKLIPKKNPGLLIAAARLVRPELRRRLVLWYVGSGELELGLKNEAARLEAEMGVRVIFHGFVNQSRITAHYLAMDLFVLPSRRMGETWGLVVNEALQGGCGVTISDAVGCGADFAGLERVRVFPSDDAAALAASIESLAVYSRDFGWARPAIGKYTVEAAARSLSAEVDEL